MPVSSHQAGPMATGWSRPFEQVIKLPDGGELVTLQDAARHIQRLPAEIHDRPEWQLAIATLINAAEGLDFVMHARIAVLRGLNGQAPGATMQQPPDPRRKAAKRYTIIPARSAR